MLNFVLVRNQFLRSNLSIRMGFDSKEILGMDDLENRLSCDSGVFIIVAS